MQDKLVSEWYMRKLWRKGTLYDPKHSTSYVKHIESSMMAWRYMTASGVGSLAYTDWILSFSNRGRKMFSEAYRSILCSKSAQCCKTDRTVVQNYFTISFHVDMPTFYFWIPDEMGRIDITMLEKLGKKLDIQIKIKYTAYHMEVILLWYAFTDTCIKI